VPADVAGTRKRVRTRFLDGDGGSGDPRRQLTALVRAEDPLLGPEAVDAVVAELARDLLGLGEVGALLDDPSVTDVLIDGPGEVLVERAGGLAPSGLILRRPEIDALIERLVTPLGLRADRSHPIVDARLEDGTRVAVVLCPVAPDGPVVALRRHSLSVLGLERFGPVRVAAALREVVEERLNIVVYGATGSGKTTLLNALVGEAPPLDRVVLIEDTCELAPVRSSLVRLEARPGNAEGAGRIPISELVRAALRLRPDRIVVGEVRGPEAADMIWALSTGHRGSMSTIHANSPEDALARLGVMVSMGLGASVPLSAVSAQVERAVDVLVGVRRIPDGGRAVRAVHRCRVGREPEEVVTC
jgi:pilus assembly protein CpaF